jgi:hypothetical protein
MGFSAPAWAADLVAGPRRVTVSEEGGRDLTSAPRSVKAAYLSYYGVADRTIRGRVFELLERTELNAVVIDVKGDRGFTPYERAWAYSIAVAGEATLKGFDEIRVDYLRFPTDGKLSAARYSRPNTQQTRLHSIIEFLKQARAALEPTGTSLAIDLFGYTAFNLDDTGVGQRIEELAPLVDTICPMAYPSAYHRGILNYRNPVAHPYEVVFETVRRVRERSAHARAQVRPWIQDFRDYAFDRRPFGVSEVGAEMKAAPDAGATGWMLWNPQNHYTVEAPAPALTPLSR